MAHLEPFLGGKVFMVALLGCWIHIISLLVYWWHIKVRSWPNPLFKTTLHIHINLKYKFDNFDERKPPWHCMSNGEVDPEVFRLIHPDPSRFIGQRRLPQTMCYIFEPTCATCTVGSYASLSVCLSVVCSLDLTKKGENNSCKKIHVSK